MRRIVLLGAAGVLAFAGCCAQPAAGALGLGGPRIAAAILLGWAAFGLAAALALGPWARDAGRPAGTRVVMFLVLLTAAVCQLPGLSGPPTSSDDAYRYVWDGRVQLSGVSPYRYAPLDDALSELRDPVLFPGLSPQDRTGFRTPEALPGNPGALTALARADPRTRINRPRVPTIYPPGGQLWFRAVASLTPARAGTLGLQLGAALLALLTTALLARLLLRHGRDPASALLWGWCPLVAHETGNGAHLDVLVAALLVLALLAGPRPGRVGALLGLAAAVKLSPLLLLPAFTPWLRGGRRWLAVPVLAVAVLLAGYLPYVLHDGSRVLGYLPGYLTEEGFTDGGQRYALLRLLLPLPSALLTAAALLIATTAALLALRRSKPEDPAMAATGLLGTAILLTAPAYPWYCLPLVALAVAAGRPAWLAVAAAAAVAGYHPLLAGWCYAAGALVVLAVELARRSQRPAPEPSVGAGAGP